MIPLPTLNSQCPCDIPGSCKIKESQKYCSIGTLDTLQDTYQEAILNSIKIEIELECDLSIVESDYNSVKINKTITFDNIQ